MITIKQVQSPVVVTDNLNTVNPTTSLYAGGTYTCEPFVANDWFELEVDTTISNGTTTPSNQFKISVVAAYNLEVDIMDGNGSQFIKGTTNTDPQLIFTFPTAGVNIIRMRGYLSLKFNTLGDSDKITDIRNWGSAGCVMGNANSVLRLYNVANVISATDTIHSANGDLRNAFNSTSWSGNNSPKFLAQNSTGCFYASALNANLGHWDMRVVSNLTNFAFGVTTWSQENYSNTLLGWLRWDSVTHAPATDYVIPSNMVFHAGTTTTTESTVAIGSEAALARDYLINTLNWTITDGGAV